MKPVQKILTVSEPDFQLIGIASHENDYRLAWAVNIALGIALAKHPDIEIYHDKYKQNISLSYFAQEFREQGYSLKLFANRGDNFFLLEDFKNIDFFLKAEGEFPQKKFQDVVDSIKAIDIVMGVYKIDIKNIKKIQRINF